MTKPNDTLKEVKEQPPTGLDLLRVPFPPHHISKLPKPTKKQKEELDANFKVGIRCKVCGGWHHKDVVHLDYVGHAALTDRLLDCDPAWNWEPLTTDAAGLPMFDANGGMWIKLTVCGITRLGYGHPDGKRGGDAIKEVIGDALRNAAMRFGAALDLWHKGDLHADEEPAKPNPQETVADEIAEFSALVNATIFAISKQPTVAALKSYWQTLDFTLQADGKVIAAKDKRKADLTREITADEIPY